MSTIKHTLVYTEQGERWLFDGKPQGGFGTLHEIGYSKKIIAGINTLPQVTFSPISDDERKMLGLNYFELLSIPKIFSVELELEKIYYPKDGEPTTVEPGWGCLFNYKPKITNNTIKINKINKILCTN